jgi:hypothetical protein
MQNRRSRFGLMIYLLVMLLLTIRAVILTVGHENTLRSNLFVMNRSSISLNELTTHIKKLESMMEDIENYKLYDIKEALQKTINLVETASQEFNAQYDAWINVKSEISKDKSSYLKLREQLEQVQKMRNSEILRFKELLDEAREPPVYADVINLLLSFLMGVISSIIATNITSWWTMRKSNS